MLLVLPAKAVSGDREMHLTNHIPLAEYRTSSRELVRAGRERSHQDKSHDLTLRDFPPSLSTSIRYIHACFECLCNTSPATARSFSVFLHGSQWTRVRV